MKKVPDLSRTCGRIRARNVFLIAALSAIASYSFAADTIKIALVGPLSGPVAQYGEMEFVGAKMAIEQINNAGGVNGKKLEGVVYDDACDPKQAVAVANKVVNDGIKFVIGHVCSSSTQPASDIYEDEGILMVTGSSTNPEITNRGYKMIFRTIGLDSMQAPTAAAYIAERAKPKVIAVLHDKQQYGEGIATAVKKSLEGKGVKVAIFEGINTGERDYSAIIAKLKQANVDFIYYGGYHPELGLLIRQSSERGLKAQFMGTEGAGNKELSAIAGPASEGLLVTLAEPFDEDPKNKSIVDAFKAKNQDPSGIFVLPSYAALSVVADSIKISKSEDPLKVADALRNNAFDTPTGNLSFDEKGDLKHFNFVVYKWHQDGSKTLVK
ncbi:branched-chain amino acid ABC transporter substrate-binding protein [Pseudomonas putida]|uniref:branched-chain amino acid ABC transporter substrate-binding protein n=1 Tax=Pseudomonas putida TaxID=303 RepID=UPI0023640153|nr:branched-chain amino acid ABC transporter substrate-binding protein [Pseudomonas putida]MDD2102694.1 branched-chain amino acid ABC transporter substrate-binding protein [Pseudomonas putida]